MLGEVRRLAPPASGDLNSDAKVRRQSTAARGLIAADTMMKDATLDRFTADRYAGWAGAEGQAVLQGQRTLESIAERALAGDAEPQPRSGRFLSWRSRKTR